MSQPDRQSAILLAAEKLFAKHGYSGVSIRQIAAEAGVPIALVGYYYGQKHELFHAVFEHWNETIQQRLQALRAVTAPAKKSGAMTGKASTTSTTSAAYVSRVIQAFTAPVLALRASPEGEWYALLMTRGLSQPGTEVDKAIKQFFDPLAHAFIDALMTAFPTRSRAQVAWGYQFMLGALLHHISDQRITQLSRKTTQANAPEAAPLLNAFIMGGLRAAMRKDF